MDISIHGYKLPDVCVDKQMSFHNSWNCLFLFVYVVCPCKGTGHTIVLDSRTLHQRRVLLSQAKYAYLRVRIRVPILRGGDGAIHLPVTLLIPSRGRQEGARGAGRARL